MRTAQKRFFDDLDEIAEGHGHELVVEYSYPNTGRATLTPAGSYQPTATFRFSFQTGHNVFESEGLFPGRSNPDMFLARNVRQLGEVLGHIEAAVS